MRAAAAMASTRARERGGWASAGAITPWRQRATSAADGPAGRALRRLRPIIARSARIAASAWSPVAKRSAETLKVRSSHLSSARPSLPFAA